MTYQAIIIGGGLSGLALAIDLKQRGHAVLVIEKGNYPRQKVCGEYVSLESQAYLFKLCPALKGLHLPLITNFKLTSTGAQKFYTKLDLGGFGISRYLLENLLYQEACAHGVDFILNEKVLKVVSQNKEQSYEVRTKSNHFEAKVVCNASGRRSNLESESEATAAKGSNYVGVKYHVKLERDASQIEIHNFPGGYCGISNIEEGKSCLCYIVNAKQLAASSRSILELERRVLFQNPHLRKIFTHADFLFEEPLTISGINFKAKRSSDPNTFYLGDSAGTIAPITGNGMSMGLRSAANLAKFLDSYYSGTITKQTLQKNYAQFWDHEFSLRIKLSRYFQKLSEYPVLTRSSIALFNRFPALAQPLIRSTHGEVF